MKKSIIVVILLVLLSCNYNDHNIITKTKIGVFKLNDILTNSYDDKDFYIKVDSNNKINTIIVYSNKFKTKDGFGVGSNFEDIKNLKDDDSEEGLSLSKGDVVIGSVGDAVVYDNILFIDNNKDKIVDLVMVANN
ncbi:hypothetical protein C1T31_09580 [Hanstruepera neustonica]|uniref:Uncharacterized protein n=1 Tax=Hanstruepera neustonica TaxID=1445657 RepID=A0A2K1DXJ6_9FLAO|nr:hypothetical protein [Hanstruepera neustonica]PNQ72756.1 hypothetical protein C1T31_09580 [Hanstruepera neustonica]